MILSDRDLARFYPQSCAIGPASIDLHLGDELLGLKPGTVLDPEIDQADAWGPVDLSSDGRWRLGHLRPYLGITRERVSVSADHVGMLHGVSSIGRIFLLIHVTAGLVDPGWERGRLTLELFPLGAPVRMRPGTRIGQITLHELTSRCELPYGHPSLGSKYQGDQHPQPSRMFREAAHGR